MEIASAPVNHYWRSIAFGIAANCLGSSLYLRIVSHEIRMIKLSVDPDHGGDVLPDLWI